MPFHDTYYDQKGGFVSCETPWGRWWQNVSEVHIEVNLPQGTRGNQCKVTTNGSNFKVTVLNDTLIEGNLFSPVLKDELIWTIEDKKSMYIILGKGDKNTKETTWEGLLQDNYLADPWLLHEMQKKLDLERFQMENPGFDFRSAKMSKGNDKVKQSKIYEWNERQEELAEKGIFVGGVQGCRQVTKEQIAADNAAKQIAADNAAKNNVAENNGAEDKGAENKGAQNNGVQNNEVEDKGAENNGAEDKGAENNGAENVGNES